MKKLLTLILVIASLAQPVEAASAKGILKSTGGVLLGFPVGGFVGGFRGAVNKAVTFSKGLSEKWGGGTLAKLGGYPVGVISGLFAGGTVGAVKGMGNGVVYGVTDPFTEKNFSVHGEDLLDYDPFDFKDSGLNEI